jgi:hypothetical protein
MRVQITDPGQAEQVANLLRELGHEVPVGTALTVTAPKKVAGRPCACGCQQITGGGLWMPGHDAKHKSALYDAIRKGNDPDASAKQKQRAEAAAAELAQRPTWGWPSDVPQPQAS